MGTLASSKASNKLSVVNFTTVERKHGMLTCLHVVTGAYMSQNTRDARTQRATNPTTPPEGSS